MKPWDIAVNEQGEVGLYRTAQWLNPGGGYPSAYFGETVSGRCQTATKHPRILFNLLDLIHETTQSIVLQRVHSL